MTTMLTPESSQSDQKSRDTHQFIRGLLSSILMKGIIPLLILIGLWSVIAWVSGGITIIDIAEDFIQLSVVGDSEGHTLLEHTGLSMFRVTLGFLVAVITAIPLGIAIGRYKSLDSVMGPVVEAMRPIPPIAWIPLAILMFSPVLLYSQIFIIWVGAFFPLLINTTTGVKRTNPVHIDVAETFGTSETGIITKIVIPSAAPEIFAGLKLGFGIGWMCLVAAEMIGSGRGLGYLVIIMQQAGRTGAVISSMLVIGLIGFIISFIFHLAEKNLLKWRQDVSI